MMPQLTGSGLTTLSSVPHSGLARPDYPGRDVECGPTVSWLHGAQDAIGLAQDVAPGRAFSSELSSGSEEVLVLEQDCRYRFHTGGVCRRLLTCRFVGCRCHGGHPRLQ